MSVMKAVHESPDLLAEHVDKLRDEIRQRNPLTLAALTGASYEETESGQGLFRMPLWGEVVILPFPALVATDEAGQQRGTMDQALLAYYLQTADGTPQSGDWIGFSEMVNGRFYSNAFQGYTGHKLSQTFVNNIERFAQAATKLNGKPESLGDCSFSFAVLPHVSILVVCWLGDEDFMTSYRVLFDANVNHHLPTDVCAILGNTLTRRLIKSR
ncbi:MAG: DUF3786 domain-containing protein [Chloroflexi bacterium]|nr:DUF3786 domain-containing protein [Chloroflexota bacterium]